MKHFACTFSVVRVKIMRAKGRFPLQPYRSETKRILLFREHSSRTNGMDTIEYATFRYDTVEVENGLYLHYQRFVDYSRNFTWENFT